AFNRFFASGGSASVSMNACSVSRVIPALPRVRAFSCSYGLLMPYRRITVWIGSASTSVCIEVRGKTRRIGGETAQALAAGDVTEQRVAEGDADIAHDRRVGQVPLPARDRQLLGEVMQQRVGQPQI